MSGPRLGSHDAANLPALGFEQARKICLVEENAFKNRWRELNEVVKQGIRAGNYPNAVETQRERDALATEFQERCAVTCPLFVFLVTCCSVLSETPTKMAGLSSGV